MALLHKMGDQGFEVYTCAVPVRCADETVQVVDVAWVECAGESSQVVLKITGGTFCWEWQFRVRGGRWINGALWVSAHSNEVGHLFQFKSDTHSN